MNINAEFEQFTAEMNLDADIAPELYREIVLPAGDRCSPIGHSGTQVVKPLRSGSCLLNESNAIGPATPVPRMFHACSTWNILPSRDRTSTDGVPLARVAESPKLPVQRRDNQLYRMCRHLGDQLRQSFVVKFCGRIVQ